MGASLGMSIGSNANECTTDMVPACPAIYIYIYISYCVGYWAIWQDIARVCEVLLEPKARVISHTSAITRNIAQ